MGLLDGFLPNYLPEDPDKREAARMGLLNFGASMLAASNKGLLPALGIGVLNGGNTYQTGLKDALEMGQKRQQQAWMKQAIGEMSGQPSDMSISQAALADGAANGSVGPTVQNASRMDQIKSAAPKQGGLSLQTLQTGALLGMKGMDPLFQMYKYQQDGIERKPGSFYRNPMTGAEEYIADPKSGLDFDSATRSVKPMRGFTETQAAIEGAKTEAQERQKARFDVLDPTRFVTQGGAPFAGTRMDFINATRAPAPSAPVTAGVEGLDTSRLTPAQIAALQKRDPQAFATGVSHFNQTAGVALQSEAEKKAQLGQIEGRQGTLNDLNKNWITSSYNPVLEAGQQAASAKANIEALRGIDLKTGSGAESKAAFANFLTGIGVAPDNAKMFATNTQRFNSVAMGTLLTRFEGQKGQQTEGDAKRVQQTFAQLNNTPEANKFIADFAEAQANIAARKAAFYRDALPLAQKEGDLNRVDREWANIQGSIWADPVMKRWAKK